MRSRLRPIAAAAVGAIACLLDAAPAAAACDASKLKRIVTGVDWDHGWTDFANVWIYDQPSDAFATITAGTYLKCLAGKGPRGRHPILIVGSDAAGWRRINTLNSTTVSLAALR